MDHHHLIVRGRSKICPVTAPLQTGDDLRVAPASQYSVLIHDTVDDPQLCKLAQQGMWKWVKHKRRGCLCRIQPYHCHLTVHQSTSNIVII